MQVEREREGRDGTHPEKLHILFEVLVLRGVEKNAVVSIAPKKTQNGERESRKKNERYVQRLSEEEPLR